jgi:hypothetical protein
MLAIHMNKALIDVDQIKEKTIECRVYNCLDGIKTWASELHHGFTSQGQPWRLGHGLGHLLGNSRTCDDRRLPPGASPSCQRLSNDWMNHHPSLGAQGVLFMPLGSHGSSSPLPSMKSCLEAKQIWFP